MTLTDQDIRAAYQQAVHGAGAMQRWAARDVIQAHLRATDTAMGPLFERLGLDLHAYFASRPVTCGTVAVMS